MIGHDHLGFTIDFSDIQNGIFIPKYYNPEIVDDLGKLNKTHELVKIGHLIEKGYLTLSTGHEVGKMAYGTGNIPFVRTSDISNWEIKTDPKQAISQEIFEQYADKQDIRAGDIFFVKDGTYLIGQSCIVTERDIPCTIQSHILKIRISKDAPFDPYLLFTALNSPITKRQIRSMQFTADIIDTIGGRFSELVLPIPRDSSICHKIEIGIKSITEKRIKLRENVRRIPMLAEGLVASLKDDLPANIMALNEQKGSPGFLTSYDSIKNGIFVPRYYDPLLEKDLVDLKSTHELISLGSLVKDDVLLWDTGIEVGKMAYGTGSIPFIRTSDISNWELKNDPKQSVSEEIYKKNKQDVQPEDIFVVRDGTYLVGSSCIVTEHDAKLLYCGGLYKLRINKPERIDPYLLLSLLNTPIVRRQMRSKQFTRDIIDTLGSRLFEILIPIPKDKKLKNSIIKLARETIQNRVISRNKIKKIMLEIEGIEDDVDLDTDSLEVPEPSLA